MLSKTTILLTLFVGSTFFISCGKDPIVPNEEELITSVIYTLKPADGGANVTFAFKDIDGDGGNPPVYTYDGTLQQNKAYTGSLTLKNEAVNPAQDITPEIAAEADDHQFFYQISGEAASSLVIVYDDTDRGGKPIGIKSKVSTGNGKGNGILKITLRHQPDKSASGVSTGNIMNAGGDTDIEILFDVDIN